MSNVDIEDLVNHLKQVIEQRNNIKFTNIEWNKFLLLLEPVSFINKMQLLREPIPFTKEDGKKIDITLVDFFNPKNNIFEVVNQVIDGHHRYDVSFLINGLPLLHCELKKPGYVDI
jgi:type I restriction enzyme R subunit